jgi:hypothetical protein
MITRSHGPTTPVQSLTVLRALVVSMVVFGFAGLILTTALAFEEPNTTLLLLSTGLLIAPAAAVFAHLFITRELTSAQRRAWFRRLTGRRALWAFGEYLSAIDLGGGAEAAGRSTDGKARRPND